MLEKKLKKLLKEANEIAQYNIANDSASYYLDSFDKLSNFILKNLGNSFVKNKSAKLIADHFDEILPFIVSSNVDILLLYTDLLIDQPNFKERFIEGLKKYQYKDGFSQLFYNIWICLYNKPGKFDSFMGTDILKVISALDINKMVYVDILNKLNEEKQKEFLNYLVTNKCDIMYALIEFKGSNRQFIYENLPLFIENAQNLYALMNFVKDNPIAFSQVKEYIDDNEEKAINSIFCETEYLVKISDPTLKEIVRLMVHEVMQNENVKFSEIVYSSGGFSRVLLIGDKVIKLGSRGTKSFPNNPYIIAPLLRRDFNSNGESFFAEITERVDTSTYVSYDEVYQLFKNLRNLGLIWTDIKDSNVGRLKKKNIIHWNENLSPSEGVLGFDTKRGNIVLQEGDLVILDADFIYDENDPNIDYLNNKSLIDKFEKRYQKEKLMSEDEISSSNTFDEINEYDLNKFVGIRR